MKRRKKTHVGLPCTQHEQRSNVFRDVEAEEAGKVEDGVEKGWRKEELGVMEEG